MYNRCSKYKWGAEKAFPRKWQLHFCLKDQSITLLWRIGLMKHFWADGDTYSRALGYKMQWRSQKEYFKRPVELDQRLCGEHGAKRNQGAGTTFYEDAGFDSKTYRNPFNYFKQRMTWSDLSFCILVDQLILVWLGLCQLNI